MIPKNIFQTWISLDFHPLIQERINKTKELNPDYNHIIYTDEDIEKFMIENYSGLILDCFNRLNIPASKIDLWRLLILYKYGGVYLDIDSSINNPLSSVISDEDTAIITAESNPNTYVQWALIFDKNHPILKRTISLIINNIVNNIHSDNIFYLTGPQVFSNAINQVHFELFGDHIDHSKITHDTNILYKKNNISYRLYGVDYNQNLSFKCPEHKFLYENKKHWSVEVKEIKLLKQKTNFDKVYVCHYKKLIERKNSILMQFKEENIYNYEFVENYDKDDWNISEIENEYPNIFKDWETGMSSYGEETQKSERSLALKHVSILKDMFEKKYESALVLEDDAILCDNFVEYCNLFMDQLSDDWDIAWVGSCLNLHEPTIDGKYVYKTDRGSRCTHAFLISKSMVNKVIDYLSDINKPSDHFYNYLIKKFNLNNYWFEPSLVTQSLEYQSSLSGNYWNNNAN